MSDKPIRDLIDEVSAIEIPDWGFAVPTELIDRLYAAAREVEK